MILGAVLAWQGRFGEAEPWIQRAERTVRPDAEPAAALLVLYVRGLVELERGRDREALAAFQAAERLARHLVAPHLLEPRVQAMLLLTLVRLGETERAEQVLADLGEQARNGQICIGVAALRLAQDDPHAASAALAPVLDGSARRPPSAWLAQAFLLEAIARDALGDPAAAGRAIERALDLAEPEGALGSFLLHPAPGLLERHARHRTAHASLLMEIRSLLAGRTPAPAAAGPQRLLEPLRDSELRVLRYLPSDLTAPEIAAELHVSPNTVKTHMRTLYAKLGTHRRHEAVERARALGLLAPSARLR